MVCYCVSLPSQTSYNQRFSDCHVPHTYLKGLVLFTRSLLGITTRVSDSVRLSEKSREFALLMSSQVLLTWPLRWPFQND